MPSHTASNIDFRVYSLSERAVTIEFDQIICSEISARVGQLNNYLNNQPFDGYCTAVPGYATLTVFYNPLQVFRSNLPGKNCFDKVSNYLGSLLNVNLINLVSPAKRVEIPVCYGAEYSLDLEEVATLHQLTVQEVIDLHSQVTYTVYLIGFVPGFAYLGGMPSVLASPRKQTPRAAVPAGSVGIAGTQTGIYPMETPGGWQIIGRTPLLLFDSKNTQPALLKAGDEVVFKPITSEEFKDFTP